MSLFRRSDIWWYEFWFAGRRIQESSKRPSKTIARTAEQNRRRELEQGFRNFTDVRHERIRTFSEVADEFFNGYKLRRMTQQCPEIRSILKGSPYSAMILGVIGE